MCKFVGICLICSKVGRAMAVAVLDMNNSNPWSRLPLSEFTSLEGVKNWVRRFVKSSKNAPSVPKKLSRVITKTSRYIMAFYFLCYFSRGIIFKFGLLSWWDIAHKTGLCNFNSRKDFVYNLKVVQNYDQIFNPKIFR